MESAFKATENIVSPGARVKIVDGDCIVSADLLQMELEHKSSVKTFRLEEFN
jgi:hypothetical protein